MAKLTEEMKTLIANQQAYIATATTNGVPNIVLTPHMAGVTEEAMMRMAQDSAEDVLRVLRGETPKFPVNREVLKK